MGQCEKPIIKVEPFLEEQITTTTKVFEDTEVDIVNWTNKGDFASNKNEDPDATDYSSSFADTTSDAENGSRLSDAEVESEFLGDNGLADTFDASSFSMRKRKLTDHWRNFIRPLMWRCKWTELRIKEIDSQALKYSKQLAECDKGKHTGANQFNLEGGSRSLPFLGEQHRSKAKMRRKRKKVEDTTDIGSYTSHHYIFSYLENKKSDPDGCLADDSSNPVIIETQADSTDRLGENHPFLDFNETDASLEQILWSIDNLRSRVHRLKSDIDSIMSKNASRFSSSENLSLLPHRDIQTSSAQSPTVSAGNGDTASVGVIYHSAQHGVDFDLGDFVMHDSAISSYGEVPMVPDIIESTVGLLSAADVTFHSALVGDSCEDMVDNVLIHEVAETDEHTFKSASNHATGKGEGEENLNPASILISDVNTATNAVVSQEQSSLKSCMYKDVNFPRYKRKRGERKACSGGWSKKCSGESENQ
ncbi:hypothetical protein Fmac_006166 [Flemingia macrophylla]|uniref:Uncharacterized protein n=1 Tax=Flemingia macrophylla TaxID=520843 RepID=A0ABD1NAC7_9FABA